MELTKAFGEISLDDNGESQNTYISTQASLLIWKELTIFLRNNQDIIA